MVTPVIGVPAGDGLRQLNLDRVDARDVMDDHAERCGHHGHARLPLGVREAGEGGQRPGALSRRSASAFARVTRARGVGVKRSVCVMGRI